MDLQTLFREEIVLKLKGELGVKSNLAVPRLLKVVVDMGVGEGAGNNNLIEQLSADLALLTAQKPQIRRAKKDVAGFGIRKGNVVGLRVTLRGIRMYEFLSKLFKIILPRTRDFRGVKRSVFDGHGNYTLGFSDHTIFPEIDAGKAARPWGLGITIVTSAGTDKDGEKLLEELGMPFEKGASS